MIRIFTTLLLLAAGIFLLGFSEDSTSTDWYPSSKDECYQWCSFDDQAALKCTSKPEVQMYLVGVMQNFHSAASKFFRHNPPGACFCAEVTLDQGGHFSDVNIVRSTGKDMELSFSEMLMEIDFDPVPIEASCLLHPPANPLPLSLDSFAK